MTIVAIIVFAVVAGVLAYVYWAKSPERQLGGEVFEPEREQPAEIDPQLGDWRGRGPRPR
jgi:hypothetical protein